MPEYDSPWKDILDRFFRDFLAICFPEAHAAIDWTRPVVPLDGELQKIHPRSARGKRTVDKLVAVHLLDGTVQRLLVHIEVQSQVDATFGQRMFEYFYRITSHFDEPVVSLAILGDGRDDWRPAGYRQSRLGCELSFAFPTVKLIDLEPELSRWQGDGNVVATVIEAHVRSIRTGDRPEVRYREKTDLVRRLFRTGLDRETVRHLFAAIDYMMTLPPELDTQFDTEIERLEKEMGVPYVTGFERRAEARAVAAGEARGEARGEIRGEARGQARGVLIGQIQFAQRLLNVEVSEIGDFETYDLDALQARLDELQKRLNDRG